MSNKYVEKKKKSQQQRLLQVLRTKNISFAFGYCNLIRDGAPAIRAVLEQSSSMVEQQSQLNCLCLWLFPWHLVALNLDSDEHA